MVRVAPSCYRAACGEWTYGNSKGSALTVTVLRVASEQLRPLEQGKLLQQV